MESFGLRQEKWKAEVPRPGEVQSGVRSCWRAANTTIHAHMRSWEYMSYIVEVEIIFSINVCLNYHSDDNI
jgi:hypothetical protein